MTAEQRQVLYSGRVQGVGFRFTACRVAAGFDVSGYVRNLPDGRVECVVEGDGKEIEAFLAAMSQEMGRTIHDQKQISAPCSGKFTTFTVRY